MLMTSARCFGGTIKSLLFGSMLSGHQRRTRRIGSRSSATSAEDFTRFVESVERRTLLSAISFQAITMQDQFSELGSASFPPDTMGAIGPDHFVEVINSSVAIYDKDTGTRLSHVSLTSFFTDAGEGIVPANGTFDPRVLYDRASGHWFANCWNGESFLRRQRHYSCRVGHVRSNWRLGSVSD